MINPAQSIRWRFALWLAFLLACVLTGFGFTAYQLHRTNRFDQLDDELERRVNALSTALRTPRPSFDCRTRFIFTATISACRAIGGRRLKR